MAELTVDALVVGGGPAGLAAAIVLARAGVPTLLCEKKRFPVDKACGEGLLPTGVVHLRALGAAPYLDAYFPFRGITYYASGGRGAAADFAEGPGWGIRRTTLSRALLQQAETLSCLQIVAGTTAEPLRREGDRIFVRVGHDVVRTRLLVGADGLNSRVRRWAGLDGRRPRWQRWGARQHFQLRPWGDHVEVYWSGRGVEAYVTPCGDACVGVAFLWDRRRFRQLRGGAGLFPSLLACFPFLQARLNGAPPLDAVAAMGPLQRRVPTPVAGGVLLIGDAAGYLDAITGEGLSLALAQALSLEETVVPHLQAGAGAIRTAHLDAYRRRHRALFRPYCRFTSLVLLLNRYPSLADRVVGALAADPALFRHLLSANMGLASPWSPSIWWRLLWGLR